MVYTITKRTTKRQFDAALKRMAKARRKRQAAALMKLCGSAPLHQDPVEYQRAMRDE